MKVKILTKTLHEFILYSKIKAYSKFEKIKINDTQIDSNEYDSIIKNIKSNNLKLNETIKTIGKGALATGLGGTAAATTYIAIGALGTASTGTAIGTLSGVAAKSATLAWLGGGSLAVGGGGIAIGTAVLSSIVAAPLVIFGMHIGAKTGKKKLDEAKIVIQEIDNNIKTIDTLVKNLNILISNCNYFYKHLSELNSKMEANNIIIKAIYSKLKERSFLRKYLIDPIRVLFGAKLITEDESRHYLTIITMIIDIRLFNDDDSVSLDACSQLDLILSTVK